MKLSDITLGQKFYIPAEKLKITDCSADQLFKIQIHILLDQDKCIVIVHHYKTRKCNKITILMNIKTIVDHAVIKIT